MAVSLIVGVNRSIRRKQPSCRKSMTNIITQSMLYRIHLPPSAIRTHNFSDDRHWLHR